MKYVFGPVTSRRLGQSLGVDPIPFKTCNWNCVYCQLGRTAPFSTERREYVPPDDIVAQIRTAVAQHAPGTIDWITFVGSGEPTLHSALGRMIREVKSFSSLPVAVITNGALLYRPELREELQAADAVLPTLDAGTEDLYLRINRPSPHVPFDVYFEGLCRFTREYHGPVWLEVMLVRGLNDTAEALHDLARAIEEVRPAEVHLNTPIRPPAEPWVEPPDQEGLMRAVAILGKSAHVIPAIDMELDLSGHESVADAILAIITRHPLPEEDLAHALSAWTQEQVRAALQELVDSGRARVVERYGRRFWAVAAARFVAPSGIPDAHALRPGCV